MMRMRYVALGGLVAVVLTARAEAQQPYPIQEMNFDRWCQEEQHLPPDRCDKRLPQDDADFQAYRSKIEKYEIPYLQQKQHDENLNRVIIHGDPIDRPTEPTTPQSPDAAPPPAGSSTPQQ
jgi:hypothetical protein